MKIVVLDGYTLNPGDLSWNEVETLGQLTVHDRTPVPLIVKRASDAEIILTNKVPISGDTMAGLSKIQFVSVMATGYDMIDIAVAASRGIPVSNVPEYGTDSVAQFVFALLLELCHHVGKHSEAARAGEWCRSPDWCFWKSPQILLKGKKIGIVGFGRIGRRVGELANAFGMDVLAYDTQPKDRPAYTPFEWKSLEEIFAESDIVTLHCPQTETNARFVNRDLIGTMKQEAFLINASRGGLVVEEDLAQALQGQKIAGAATDVASVEPIKQENPLLQAENCLITPHIAWASQDARKNLMRQTAENIKAFMAGTPIHVVNQQYLKR